MVPRTLVERLLCKGQLVKARSRGEVLGNLSISGRLARHLDQQHLGCISMRVQGRLFRVQGPHSGAVACAGTSLSSVRRGYIGLSMIRPHDHRTHISAFELWRLGPRSFKTPAQLDRP